MSAVMRVVDAPNLAAEINAEHERAYGKAREALLHARRAGELLLKAKATVGHGKWLPWLTENVKFSGRTAQGYMRIASHWDKLNKTVGLDVRRECASVADLGIGDALKLLRPPEEVDLDKMLDEMRALGGEFEPLADRWMATAEDAEELTRLIGNRIAEDCSRAADRHGIPYEFVSGAVLAMIKQEFAAS